MNYMDCVMKYRAEFMKYQSYRMNNAQQIMKYLVQKMNMQTLKSNYASELTNNREPIMKCRS